MLKHQKHLNGGIGVIQMTVYCWCSPNVCFVPFQASFQMGGLGCFGTTMTLSGSRPVPLTANKKTYISTLTDNMLKVPFKKTGYATR